MGTYSLVTAPSSEPVTVAELKEHLRIDTSDDDTYLGLLIKAARQSIESEQNRAMISQVWRYKCEYFPCEFQLLPSPVTAITSITYIDLDGDTQTLSASVYQTDLTGVVGRVRLAYNQTWPNVRGGDYGGVTVNFTAGAANAAAVDETDKHCIKLLCGHWYESREAVGDQAMPEIPLAFQHLLNRNKIIHLP